MEQVIDILESLANEKGLPLDTTIRAFKASLDRTAKQLTTQTTKFSISVDLKNRTYKIDKIINIVSPDDERLYAEEEDDSLITAKEALDEYDLTLEDGDEIREKFELTDYGRSASFNLFNNLQYQVQREVEQSIFEKYQNKIGTIINAIVTRVDKEENTFCEVNELKGILKLRNRIKGETFEKGDNLKAILRFVNIDPNFGLILELTRTSPLFLEKLLEQEVPEISDQTVKIIKSARIPGQRAKISLESYSTRIDPIGAVIGVKGVRINAVSGLLCNERIDCIQYSNIPEIMISRALSPAVVKNIKLNLNHYTEKQEAIVDITSDQKAKAIGKNGINIKLVSMLTGYAIIFNDVEGEINDSLDSYNNKKSSGTDALSKLFN